jgi:hypothetical protein
MVITKLHQKTEALIDKEVLFFYKVAELELNKEDLNKPEKYVEVINKLAHPKTTSVSQVLGVIPKFIAQLEKEDFYLTYKHLGLI